MQHLFQQRTSGGMAHVAHTTRADGDLSPAVVDVRLLIERRRSLVDHPWFSCRQVHSDRVVTIGAADRPDYDESDDARAHDEPQADAGLGRRAIADALVTARAAVALAVHAGDCVPVGFVHSCGAVAVAHAGWRGLVAGVLESTVRSLRSYGEHTIAAAVGPHIRAQNYEFGDAELGELSQRLGPRVRSATAQGTPALDLTAAVESELSRLGVGIAASSGDCTAVESDRYWSHRARNESGRIALIAWIAP